MRAAVYTSSQGNFFFHEISGLLAAGLRELGVRVEERCERHGFSRTAGLHIVVAPHEFFYLGRGVRLRKSVLPRELVLYTTEQPGSPWFALSKKLFARAKAVWEIDSETASRLRGEGVPCRHLPLGWAQKAGVYRPVRALPRHYGTSMLEPGVLRSPGMLPLERRPIDVLFTGNHTERRDRFFTRAAPLLARFRCYLHFTDASRPIVDGESTSLNSPISIGLVQRVKIVLNIHRYQSRYFEWQRLVLHGMGQKALVLSEPCTDAPPFRPGRDFIEAPLSDFPRIIGRLLSKGAGRRRAQKVADAGFETLTRRCRLSDRLRPLLEELRTGVRRPSRDLGSRAPVRAAAAVGPVPAEIRRKSRSRKKPKITVAVTLHDYAGYILPCLDSVRGQTLRDLDLVVVDDASSDGSARKAGRWLERHGKRFSDWKLVLHRENAGLARARNAGFREARTPYVFVLDADNLLYPRCLESLSKGLERSGADFAYSYLNRFGDEEGLMNAMAWKTSALLSGNYIDAMALVRRSGWKKLGGYRAHEVQGWEDFDFWLRLAKAGGWGVLVPEILAAYRVHLRSMVHRETNPNAKRLESFFGSAFGVEFRDGESSAVDLACRMFGSRDADPRTDGDGRVKRDKYWAGAASLLYAMNKDLKKR